MMIPESFAVELVPWKEAVALSKDLGECIRGKYHPDLVIAIGRGGYVPGRVVCDSLLITTLTSIKIEHWGEAANCYGEAHIRYPLSVDVEGQDLLVVDDVTDTGKTLIAAIEYLQSLRPGSIKTGVLHHKTTSTFIPDFYAKMVPEWHWIVYPWALHEDLVGFVEKVMTGRSATPGKIRSALNKRYHMRPGMDDVVFAARELVERGIAEETRDGYRLKNIL
ncbi:MAG: xanthine-guanine phosphoribosyltransferase [Methanoregulaceae archaeon PtaB.Bin009]|jgi:hypoxanthine phosphoribosyltransferase|nr:MAG: xanthine-guanine phosphoribosyltransferase [Methanoregulaceae archaeon PtaB.Bin009]HNQ29221.1 phosphoribosyltransferase [Methanolinea sp.]